MDKTIKQYHIVNNAIGWLIGIIACVVYIMTAEATASWWDCGEYSPPLLNYKWVTLLEHLHSKCSVACFRCSPTHITQLSLSM